MKKSNAFGSIYLNQKCIGRLKSVHLSLARILKTKVAFFLTTEHNIRIFLVFTSFQKELRSILAHTFLKTLALLEMRELVQIRYAC